MAQELLKERLAEHGYYQSKIIPGLWKHKTRPIVFTLVVDDFEVKYANKKDAEHLMSVLKQEYEGTEDWKGERYIGMHLSWDYVGRKVHLTMPGYAEKTLREFLHVHPRCRQYSPFPCAQKKYGKEAQMIEKLSESPPLSKAEQKFIQKVTGKFL